MTPAFSWALAMLVAGAAVSVAVVSILPKGSPMPRQNVVADEAPKPAATDQTEPAKAETVAEQEQAPKAEIASQAKTEVTKPAPAPTSADAADNLLLAPPKEEEPVVVEPILPSFDTVRVDAEGAAVVAGRAGPGAKVLLLSGSETMAETRADISGNFVALFDVPADGKGRLLALKAETPDGGMVAGAETVALAPVGQPEAAVAVAEPAEAEPAMEASPPAALVVSDGGARVLDAPPPAGPVSIDTFSTDANGKAQIAGRGEPGLTLRVYLDNAAVQELPVGADGRWQLELSKIAEGEHLVRVDQIASDGSVASRAEQAVIREPVVVAKAPVVAPLPQTPEPVAAAPVTDESVDEAVAAMVKLGDETAESAAPANNVAESAPAKAAAETEDVPLPPADPVTVTVKPGYSLWRIASEQLGDGVLYVQLFEANKDQIRDPDLIYPGQIFTIPAP